MLSAESFLTSSLRSLPEGHSIARILAASIHAVEPGSVVERFVRRSGNILNVAGRTYNLSDYCRVNLLGIGKAAVGMSTKMAGILGTRLQDGLVITKHITEVIDYPLTLLEGGHPIPDAHSLLAGQRALEFISSLCPDDLLFCLVSGGGSALMTTPLEGLHLQDLQLFTSTLLACGARIDEINSLRRRLERLKGGGLVSVSNGATLVSLILSDVAGDPLEGIASGPTAPDPTTREDVRALLKKYDLNTKTPSSILDALEHAPETLKPEDPAFARVQNVIVGNNLMAVQAALDQARKEGFHAQLLRSDLQGEARQTGSGLASILRDARTAAHRVPPPACMVAGGETTVTIRGSGRGGRNTELALAAVPGLAGLSDGVMVTLATDGEDGPTDAAGAVVTGETSRRAAGLNLDSVDFLDRNDSYPFFATLKDLVKPGPTGTNVNDLVFLFVL